MEQSRNNFRIICSITVICALGLSAISMLTQPGPLFAAFLAINTVSLIVNIVCFIIKRNNTTAPFVSAGALLL